MGYGQERLKVVVELEERTLKLLEMILLPSNHIFFQDGDNSNQESEVDAQAIEDLLAFQDMDEFVNAPSKPTSLITRRRNGNLHASLVVSSWYIASNNLSSISINLVDRLDDNEMAMVTPQGKIDKSKQEEEFIIGSLEFVVRPWGSKEEEDNERVFMYLKLLTTNRMPGFNVASIGEQVTSSVCNIRVVAIAKSINQP